MSLSPITLAAEIQKACESMLDTLRCNCQTHRRWKQGMMQELLTGKTRLF